MNNQLAIATVDTLGADKVKGLTIVTSEKTGNSRIGLMKKKDWIERYKKLPGNDSKTNKQAVQAFDQYRVSTLQAFNAEVARKVAAGEIVVEGARADDTGDLRTLTLVKRSAAERDRDTTAFARVAAATGMSIEQLAAMAKAHGSNVAIDIKTTEVKGEASGNTDTSGTQSSEQQSTAPAQAQDTAASTPSEHVVNPPQSAAA